MWMSFGKLVIFFINGNVALASVAHICLLLVAVALCAFDIVEIRKTFAPDLLGGGGGQ